MNKKKIVAMLIMVVLMLTTIIGCTYVPPVGGFEDDENPNTGDEYVGTLKEQNFSNALDAFKFGDEYFNDTVGFYESTQKGVAVAMGFNTYVITKRFKSDVTNNFLYETNTYSNMNNPDPSFGLKAYRNDGSDTVYYKRVDGKHNASSNPNGAKIDDENSSSNFNASVTDFTGLTAETKDNWNSYKQDVGGNIPQNLTVYNIKADTIESSTFEKDKDGYAYQFSFKLKEEAVEDYKHQVELCSKQTWSRFTFCEISFKMDKYGRIQQVNVNEVYSVSTGSAGASVNNISVEYISYNKRPEIEFLDSANKIVGSNIEYAELPSNEVPIETYNITFKSAGGSACEDKEVYFNTEIGALPVPTHELESAYFAGWFTLADGKGEQFTEKSSYVLKSDLELFAFWQYVDPALGTFTLNDDDEYVLAAVGTAVSGAYTVPETYMGKRVAAIGDEAFRNNDKVKVVVLSKFITAIGDAAFSGSDIRSLAFRDESSLVSIGNAAFKDCKNLVFVELLSPLEKIGESAFENCVKLSDISLPETLKVINAKAFLKCAAANATLDEGSVLESIKVSAFEGASIKFTTMPDTLTEIGVKAFYKCTLTVSSIFNRPIFVVSANIEVLSENAFGEFVAPMLGMFFEFAEGSKLTTIGKQAFRGTASTPTNILGMKGLPEGLKTIGDSAFQYCNIAGTETDLVSDPSGGTFLPLVLPSTVETIGINAFDGCTNLSIDISNTQITTVANYAFRGCSAIKTIELPLTVASVGNYAFNNCAALTDINLAELELTSIGTSVFQGCAALVNVNLPATITSIGGSAFRDCVKLENINLEDTKITTIGTSVFQGCVKLAEIRLPATVGSIGASAFAGCTGLVSITILKADGVVTLSNVNAIPSANINLKIYVASSLVATYKAAINWLNANITGKIFAIAE